MPKTGRKWWKYSPEFKQQAVQRMQAGEGVAAVARELGIRRKFLYEWRDQGYGGGEPVRRGKAAAEADDPMSRENSALKKRMADLERLVGKQASELDFFAAALRSVGRSGTGTATPEGGALTGKYGIMVESVGQKFAWAEQLGGYERCTPRRVLTMSNRWASLHWAGR